MWEVAVLIIVMVVEVVLILKWKIWAMTLIYYMELKKYTQPNKAEMEVCTRKVIRHMIRDLICLK